MGALHGGGASAVAAREAAREDDIEMATKKTALDRLMDDTKGLPAADRASLANKLTKTGVVTTSDVERARRRSPRA